MSLARPCRSFVNSWSRFISLLCQVKSRRLQLEHLKRRGLRHALTARWRVCRRFRRVRRLRQIKKVLRRIGRQMHIHKLESFRDYHRFLMERPGEVERLLNSLLINVTDFFRDEAAFDVLENLIIPEIFSEKASDSEVRIWVPACATGEEAYSIAILLAEHLHHLVEGSVREQLAVQAFDRHCSVEDSLRGSDISEQTRRVP